MALEKTITGRLRDIDRRLMMRSEMGCGCSQNVTYGEKPATADRRASGKKEERSREARESRFPADGG